MKIISVKGATVTIITISTLAIIMHMLILTGLLPSSFVWGGRLQSREEVIVFELVSIAVQLLFILIVLSKAGIVLKKWRRTATMGIWLLFGLMVLNTIGNLASLSNLETIIMTPITALLAVLLLRLAIEK